MSVFVTANKKRRSIQHKSSLKNYKSWVDSRSWGRREPPPPPLFLPAPPPLLPGGVTGGEGWAEPVNPGQGATARGTGGTPLRLPPSPVEVPPRKLKSTPSAPVLTRMDTSVDPGGIL
jgi:hypothetical protein